LGETGLARDEDGSVVWTIRTILFRIEIVAALQRDIPVVPILVDAKVPNADQLPKDLEELSFRNEFKGQRRPISGSQRHRL
jgi:hypothetical protein